MSENIPKSTKYLKIILKYLPELKKA